jgi:Secretion system C-terminal sorting domain
MVDENTGYIACGSLNGVYDGAILKTTDGGSNWRILTNTSRPVGAVFFLNTQLGWATSFSETSKTNKIILKTTNGGQNWSATTIILEGCYDKLVDIVFTTPQKGFAIADCGILIKTTDGGTTWSKVNGLPAVYSYATQINFANEWVGYINIKNTQLAKTVDGGTTWELLPIQNNDVSGALGALSVVDVNTVFVGGSTGILKTTTGGKTTKLQFRPIPATTYCAGSSLKLPLRATGTFDTNNNFTVQLSNTIGSFATPTTLTTFTNIGNDSIICALPSTLTQGNNYRIRVVSNSPALVSDTTAALTINAMPSLSVAISPNSGNQICTGTNAMFQAIHPNLGTAPEYQWKLNGTNVGTDTSTFSSTNLQNDDVLWVEIRSNMACASATPTPSAPLSMQVATVPTPFIQAIENTLTSSSTTGNQWFLNGQAVPGATNQFYALTSNGQNGSYTVRVTQNSCSATSQPFAFTYIAPSVSIQPLPKINYCVGAALKIPYFLNGTFNTNTTYIAQLSNATGSFAAPITVYSSTTLPIDTIQCALPLTSPNGDGYRLRITTSNPITVSEPTLPFAVTNLPIPTIQMLGNTLASNVTSGNQWFFNGQAIANATNQVYTAKVTGFYTVRVTTNTCSAMSAVFSHIVTATNEIDNNQLLVKVYPNPTTGRFTIDLENNTSTETQVILLNTLGQIVLRQDLINNMGQFDVTSMTAGIYLIKIRTAKSEIWKRIVLNR